jgi:regulator of protease activity HflC (stomatin/prohibitin superfamily)
MQRFGKETGIAAPGGKVTPPWYRIAYVVTQQSCTYNVPVKECPTIDNVRVGIDIVIVFMIREPSIFVEKLGAVKFDQLLSGAVDEGIRILVRSQRYDEVFLLTGNRAEMLVTHLNTKFKGLGVNFNNCTIQHVKLPDDLAQSLQNATKMKKEMEEKTRTHTFNMDAVQKNSLFTLDEVAKKNEQTIVAEQGRKKRAGLTREQQVVKAGEERQVKVIEIQQTTQVQLAEVKAQLQRTETDLARYRVEHISKAEADAEARRVQADIAFEKITVDAEAEKNRYMGDAQAIKLEASAEKETSKHLVQKRKFELDMREKQILNKLAAKGNFNLIGDHGDKMVDAVMSGKFSDPSGGAGGSGGWLSRK